jgi:hypothetical protein
MGGSNKPPLKHLSLEATKITERGFAVFVNELDNIFAHMDRAFYKMPPEETLMSLSVGDNRLSDHCVKRVADLVRKYDCFCSLKMNKLH